MPQGQTNIAQKTEGNDPLVLLIRADASAAIGTGHVMRMIALAQAWRRRGGEARFLCCLCPEGIRQRVEEAGFPVQMIKADRGSREDLAAVLGVLDESPGARLALDGYHFELNYQRAVKDAAKRLLVVDDYGHLPEYAAHVILNQNPSAPDLDLPKRAPGAMVLAGTRFALIREEFLALRPEAKSPKEGALNVLVTMGGADQANVTGKVIQALLPLGSRIAELRVIAGGANPNLPALESSLDSAPFPTGLLVNARDMPEQLAWADAAIAAAGSTCWELGLMEVPTAAVVVADNQREIAAALEREGAVIDLGWHEDATAEVMTTKLAAFLNESSSRAKLGVRLNTLLDAKGAERVAASIDGRLRVTIATAEDTWMNGHITEFINWLIGEGHVVASVHHAVDIESSDVTFILSFENPVGSAILDWSTHNIVVHASPLPKGRGWSPMTWQILEGASSIPVTLFEARSAVDSGEIYDVGGIELEGHELVDEWRTMLAAEIIRLCKTFVRQFPAILSERRMQTGTASYYDRRGPGHSELNPELPIKDQFDLFRVVDNRRYPAFFELRGHRYALHINKIFKCTE